MPSHRFKNVSSGRSARNTSNNFLSFTAGPSYHYGNVYSSSDMTHVEESANDLAHVDKRSAHNALERQRRENLNSKFQQLAHALPSLQSVRRPSKTVIVAKSLEFVSSSVNRETKFQNQIEHLRRENERLRDQASKTKHPRHSRQQQTVASSILDGTISSSSSSASSILEQQQQQQQQQQPMYLSPSLLFNTNGAATVDQVAVRGADTTAATYSSGNATTTQLSPPPSPTPAVPVPTSNNNSDAHNIATTATKKENKSTPAPSTKTSPKRKASSIFDSGNNDEPLKREKQSPAARNVDSVKMAMTPTTTIGKQKMRQNSTSSLDASFMMMMTTSDAAPPPDQSAAVVVAAMAEQQQPGCLRRRRSSAQHQQQQQYQPVATPMTFLQQQQQQQPQHVMVRTSSDGNMMPNFMTGHPTYYEQQQQQQQFMMNMAVAAAASAATTAGGPQHFDVQQQHPLYHHRQQHQVQHPHPAATASLMVNNGNYPHHPTLMNLRYDSLQAPAGSMTTTTMPQGTAAFNMQDTNNDNNSMSAAAAVAAVSTMSTSVVAQQYPQLNLDIQSMYPPPYFQHDPSDDYHHHGFNWS